MSSIDIAIPCYQYGRFLRDSVGSVLAQNVGQMRVLILDNSSTDNSCEVAEQLAKEDARVSLVSHKRNIGQQANYNAAIDWAAADYFVTLDADDMLPPGSLARAIAILDRCPNVVFAHGVEEQFSGKPPKADIAASALQGHWRIESGLAFIRKLCGTGYNPVGWPTVVRRTDAQKKIGYHREGLKFADDMNMWLRMATLGDVAETTSVQGLRRVHPAQITEFYRNSTLHAFTHRLDNFDDFFTNEGALIPNASREHLRVSRRIALNVARSGTKLVCLGDWKQGLQCLGFAMHTLGRNRTAATRQPCAEAMTIERR